MAIKHRHISDHCKQQMWEKNIFLKGLYNRFYLNKLPLTQSNFMAVSGSVRTVHETCSLIES